jgi:Mlc titration factor MtfA (ptsG expression regulator)
MWSLRAWRDRRILKRISVSPALWAEVHSRLPILAELDSEEDALLRQRSVLFLAHKHLTLLGNVTLDEDDRLVLAAQAQLPLLHLPEGDWYGNFHELIIYPSDFASPHRYRDSNGIEHEGYDERSGEAWLQGPVILAWLGVSESGDWHGYNLVIHELAHKLDMLNGEANGLPPLHHGMAIAQWAEAFQAAYDDLNQQLEQGMESLIDSYAAEHPAEFFAVCCEYFFCAPDILYSAYPHVYAQLLQFFRQDPLQRLHRLAQRSSASAPTPAVSNDAR